MPVRLDIATTHTNLTADRRLDLADAKAVLAAAGKSVSPPELEEVAQTLVSKGKFTIDVEARTFWRGEVKTLKTLRAQAKAQNEDVARRAPGLLADAKAKLVEGTATTSYGGSVVPEGVKQVLNAMLANGATVFDVAEMDPRIGRDDHDANAWAASGQWSPWAQESAPVGTLSSADGEESVAEVHENPVVADGVVDGVVDERRLELLGHEGRVAGGLEQMFEASEQFIARGRFEHQASSDAAAWGHQLRRAKTFRQALVASEDDAEQLTRIEVLAGENTEFAEDAGDDLLAFVEDEHRSAARRRDVLKPLFFREP